MQQDNRSQVLKQEAMMSTRSRISASQVFAIVQQISPHINKDQIQEIVNNATGLDIEDKQIVVDLLSIALEKSHHLLKNPDRILLLLVKLASSSNVTARNRIIDIASNQERSSKKAAKKRHHVLKNAESVRLIFTRIVSSANALARNRTIRSKRITSDEELSFDVFKLPGKQPVYLDVMRRGKKDTAEFFNDHLITWAHLSHPNVLPVYGAFLEGDDGPISFVSPQMPNGNISDHAKTLSQAARMPLIYDVIDGLCYLHHLNIVHGALNPQNVVVSPDRRALITGLDGSFESSSVRYSAPEILAQSNSQAKTASDIWSLGCIIYEVLSGKIPFYQILQEGRVGAAVSTYQKPNRPREGDGVGEIVDVIWAPVSSCWESETEDRPTAFQLQKIFSGMAIHDDRPVPSSIVQPEDFVYRKGPPLNLEFAKFILPQIVGSNLSMPPPSQIPEHLQKPLFGLADNLPKAEAIAVAAKKLNPNDTQTLTDVLNLIIEENPALLNTQTPVVKLLRKIVASTHTLPHCCKINRIRYNPVPIAEGDFGKVYKARDLEVCVSVVARPSDVSETVKDLALCAHSSHPNVLPLYGAFHENVNEIPRFCLVSPYMKNGLLHDYALDLPQKERILLISDAINALVYLQGLNIKFNNIRGDRFLISDEGRALITGFGTPEILTAPGDAGSIYASAPYALRFYSPERAKKNETGHEASVWSFGCLLYEVFSKKVPYHQYTDSSEIRSALLQGETPKRPSAADDNIDEIDDQFWALIMACCVPEPGDRLTLLEVQKLFSDMKIQDHRPEATSLSNIEALALKTPDISWDDIKGILDQIQVELLRTPLSKLIQNHTKDVAAAATRLSLVEDRRTFVDFLDLALKNHITVSDERNRVLALLSRIVTSTHIFPHRYELKGIKYCSSSIAEGGFGTIHLGVSDPNLCVKVMTNVDPEALTGFVKELILWAHASHPNVLPFYGVFVDDFKRICLVSPFMTKGNLHNYAPQLVQKHRIPLLLDVIKGLVYLHGLGVVHTDLKGENVLISDEGRGLITDFGASHVITATAKGGVTTAAVASTLRFTAPEIISNRYSRPTQECDIWSFGCLCYEVLSRKLPYFEYSFEAQIYAALSRGQPPKRPIYSNGGSDDEEDYDLFDEPDWDEIDDPAWSVITHCCTSKPDDRPRASRIQELIVDLKMWDARPEAKDTPSAHLLSLRSNPDVNLNRAGQLLNELQVRFLAQKTLRYSTEHVITAVTKLKLEDDDAIELVNFWDLVLKDHVFTSCETNKALALLSALVCSSQILPYRYVLPTAIQYNPAPIGSGSFGTVHRGYDPNLCVKVTNYARLHSDLTAPRRKVVAPSAYSSHPNVLPFYGSFSRETSCGRVAFLVSPFIKNGNLHNYAPRLSQKLQMPLIWDIVKAVKYLHGLGIVHGNLKGENILISAEGRALVADLRPYHINVAATEGGPTGSYITSTLRFTAPELVKNSQMLPTIKSDVWSIGCLAHLVLSGKDPFYHYSRDAEIRSALSQGELPARPMSKDDGADEIDNVSWDLVTKCCTPEPDTRPMLSDIHKWLANLGIQDNRPPGKPMPGAETLKLWDPHPGIDIERVGNILDQIKSHLPLVIGDDGERDDQSRN